MIQIIAAVIGSAIMIILVFYQRVVFENSITSFGVDYLIYIVCCYFLLNKIKNLHTYRT